MVCKTTTFCRGSSDLIQLEGIEHKSERMNDWANGKFIDMIFKLHIAWQ